MALALTAAGIRAAVLDAAGTVWTLEVVRDLSRPPDDGAATVLATLSLLKWVAVAVAVGAVPLRLGERWRRRSRR
ncbi:hypothetical protein [Symbioplanes lichenis]|uniref:hypothetical protein n=1 Tax=Symbioplanes lichenis TaxID=1629072 RepID=UPI002738E3BE|nr:hypothetical protein [Actinoplanes lichenis]